MQVQALTRFFDQTQAMASAVLKTLLQSLASRSEYGVVMETTGTEFVIWRKGNAAGAPGVSSSAVYPLGLVALEKALSEIDYIGEPVTVVLHPPCVCLKSFSPSAENPGMWLASHLVEILPPGNRRELVMGYRKWNFDHLLAAFVRRSFLTRLRDLLQKARVSVQGIYVGGSMAADSLTQRSDVRAEQSIVFSLCTYEVTRNRDGAQVLPRLTETKLPGRLSNLLSLSLAITAQGEQIDFREQIGFPRVPSSRVTRWIVRAEFVLILILMGAILLHWGMWAITGDRSPAPDYLLAERALDELREQNEKIAREVDLAYKLQQPKYNTCDFLKSIALATPPQVWLTSISFGTAASEASSAFGLNGLSLNGDEPLCLADSLRNDRDMRSVALTKAGIVENPGPVPKHKLFRDHLTKFEITGNYARK